MKYEVTVGERVFMVDVDREGEGFRVAVDGQPSRHVDVHNLGSVLSVMLDGHSVDAGLAKEEGGWLVNLFGTEHHCEVVDPRRKALRMAGAAHQGTLSTSMPGRVVAIQTVVGDVVTKGQSLVVVEAMKMENELKAPIDGTVLEILVAEGQALEAGAKLIRIG